MKHEHFNVLVVGAGPAGLAAAASAAQQTSGVGLVDDNPAAGGQIWRSAVDHVATAPARRWLAQVKANAVTMHNSARVIAPLKHKTLLVETPAETLAMHFERLILATGARELFLPFPGWTLPGVMGAGGLQALVKGGLPITGKRVVVAGSGPLLLAVAAYLKGKGARVLLVAEQTSRTRLGRFAWQLASHPGHIKQAVELGGRLLGVPIRTGCWVQEAPGTERLTAVTLHQHGHTWTTPCDYLACGFGLVPNSEIASALGCAIVSGAVQVNEWQQSSLADIYCAGEASGIGGLDLSLAEGQIAGLAATNAMSAARQHFPERQRARRFAAALQRGFAPRADLKELADDNTLICRCEDVPLRAVKQYTSWRSAKLQTRCGMGPCQGRICGAATTFLFGWGQDSVRPPLTAARIQSFAQVNTDTI